MKKYTGKPVCKGTRSGAVFVIKESREPVKRKKNRKSRGEIESPEKCVRGICKPASEATLQSNQGKELFYSGDWIDKPGVAICSCNDGLRPVIIKIETVEGERDGF